MSDFYNTARELLADVLEIECPEAAAFLKSGKGHRDHDMFVELHKQQSGHPSDVAYHAAVSAFQRAQSDFKEAEDFLKSRIAYSIYLDRVGEAARKADFEAEQAERGAEEHRNRLKEKLDRLTRDGILTNEERKELDRSPFLMGGNDDLPW